MNKPEEPLRPLELDPARVMRADRPHYAIIDIGSNSVRLMVYDQLGRAPMPRFNEKSLCRLAEGLAQTGAIAPDGFRRTVEAVRRFRAIAEAMGVGKLDVTATEATRRASNGPALAKAISAETGLAVRILSGAEEARYATLGVISGFFRPVGTVGDMGGGSLEVAEAIDDRVGERWVSLPLGALPVEAMLADGYSAAKRQVDEILRGSLESSAGAPGFLSRRRRLARARQGAHRNGPTLRSRSCTAIRWKPRSRATLRNRCCVSRRTNWPRRRASRRVGRARFRLRRWCWIGC